MIDMRDVKTLLQQMGEKTLTLYLNVNNAVRENQADNPAWRIFAKDALRDQSDKAARERVEDYLVQYRPRGRTLVLFASAAQLRAYELPFDLPNAVQYGQPYVMPLVWGLDEYEPYLIALVDQEKARFILTYLGEAEVQDALEIGLDEYDFGEKSLVPRTGKVAAGDGIRAGQNREAFEDMIDEHRARFYRLVGDRIETLLTENQARRVIIGGAEESAHAVEDHLPARVKAQVVGVLPSITLHDSLPDVQGKMLDAALKYERQAELEVVNDVIDRAKAGGRGALGRDDVRAALTMQQVDLLIVPYPIDDDELAVEFANHALELNSDIELVHGEAAARLRAEGEVAARLYYALQTE